jgi:hypothetical protein
MRPQPRLFKVQLMNVNGLRVCGEWHAAWNKIEKEALA